MIPTTLWQTAKSSSDLHDKNVKQLVKSWVVTNPTFDFFFMDDVLCDRFIKDNFSSEIYAIYKAFPLGIMRADFWRIAVLYINGGIYSDIDVFCNKSISELLGDKDIILLQEHDGLNNVSNFFMAAKPKHPIIKEILDTLILNYKKAFDITSNMMVQNFGMHSIQIVVDKHNIELLPKNIWQEYIKHECHGSWRESEIQYKNIDNMKPITFFTTFHQQGYDLYGKTWIQTFIDNVAPKGSHIKAIVFADDVKNLNIKHPQVIILNFKDQLPEHEDWKMEFSKYQEKYSKYVYDNAIRFSHKGFVINRALDLIKSGYAIWLDGDCVMHDSEYKNFPKNILQDNSVIACQLEHVANNHHHIESGFLLFDMDNDDIENFKDEFRKNYSISEITKMHEPYDGFIVYKSINQSNIKWNNLNEKYGIGGIQSDPSLTFLHPEIKSRFTHNIGLTGKEQYESWDDVKYQDNVYSQLAAVGVLTEKQLKVRSLLKKKIKLHELS